MENKSKSATLWTSNDYLNPALFPSLLSYEPPSSRLPLNSGSGQARRYSRHTFPMPRFLRHYASPYCKVYCAAYCAVRVMPILSLTMTPARDPRLLPVHIVAPKSRSWLTLIMRAISHADSYHHRDTASLPPPSPTCKSAAALSVLATLAVIIMAALSLHGVFTAPHASKSIAAAAAAASTILHIPDCSVGRVESTTRRK
ncbi:hypothetical protein GALMADRAFT_570068 [Galerina marginata CBS 339.88]|uniref:Uncharacterized protein n=1 Tax=Galerina marginata (strain CBS 339.88) TaxID=685588 RepID=A0A067SVN5_GALM3|nr:hypothetical protein GALMADRAFT_570068 [Galerina marginata CBS 339.88]